MDRVHSLPRPHLRSVLTRCTALLALLPLLGGCGDNGGGNAPGGLTGRYLGTFTVTGGARQTDPADGGVLSLLVDADGKVALEAVSLLSPEPIRAEGSVATDGTLTTLTDSIDGGATVSFSGTIADQSGVLTGSGTWTAVAGPDGPRAGTWTARPAPATHPFAGQYLGSYTFQEIENQRSGTMDLTVDAAGRVTVFDLNPTPPANARQASAVTGWVDPQTGAIAAVGPYPVGQNIPEGSIASLGGTLSTTALQTVSMRVWPTDAGRFLRGGFNIPLIAVIAIIQGTLASGQTEYAVDHQRSGALQSIPDGAVFFQGVAQAGDTSANRAIQTFLTFDLTQHDLAGNEFGGAVLPLTRGTVTGDPFTGREFFLERVEYTGSPTQFGSGPPPAGAQSIGLTATNAETTVNVLPFLKQALAEGKTTLQFRLRFEPTNDGDNAADTIDFDVANLRVTSYPPRPTHP